MYAHQEGNHQTIQDLDKYSKDVDLTTHTQKFELDRSYYCTLHPPIEKDSTGLGVMN
jgi:hypothetical protein